MTETEPRSLTAKEWQALADIAGAWEALHSLEKLRLLTGPPIDMGIVRETLECCSSKGFAPIHSRGLELAAAAAGGGLPELAQAPGRHWTVAETP